MTAFTFSTHVSMPDESLVMVEVETSISEGTDKPDDYGEVIVDKVTTAPNQPHVEGGVDLMPTLTKDQLEELRHEAYHGFVGEI